MAGDAPLDVTPEDEVEMGFFEHIGELRVRMFRAVLGLIPGVALGWVFRQELLSFLVAPFQQAWLGVYKDEPPKLVFLNPVDPFVAYLKIALIMGLVIGAPWAFWQLWGFISPGLYRREKRLALPFVIVASFFFFSGLAFGYTIVFPMAFQYFLEFAVVLPGGVRIEPTIAINEILGFEVRMLLAFGLVFQLPVIIGFISAAGLVHWKTLLGFSRWWVLIAAILSALLTPPDVGSQLLMLVPLVVLWFVSILIAFLIGRRRDAP